ncbi:hypothetical protein GA0074695_1002 [Micromonospora viridifaciens]|uniref:Uncharacterized protein n=1 Tax=Micromonospora viridifaciens TaxID=1881 RepID=A0A1C4V078_MICVI|nr:hypothetical protein [Micromonospora viridifaciens]SCE77420.1 hypothetical protein GA0074695_1002 [Micromonospora viridifaciens]
MGFWGTLVICRGAVALAELPVIRALGREAEPWAGPWRPGWRGWRIWGSTPEGLPGELATAGLAPLLTAQVLDSDAALVTGIDPAGGSWAGWLRLEAALGHLVPPPAPFDDEGNWIDVDIEDPAAFPAYHEELAETRARLLAAAPGGRATAEGAVAWAAGSGLPAPSVDAVLAVLASERVFVEEQVWELVRLLGPVGPVGPVGPD